jgi:hypothetical protein
MTAKLLYTESELFSDHEFVRPQVVHGMRLHGGFLADGTYRPPRALGRGEAIDAWTAALRERGGEWLDADSSLLHGKRMPNLAQHRLLLREGLGRAFWNMLTITGKIEARGRLLAEISFPDLQEAVVDDISHMAIGHLGRGLLAAHGLDEGGQPDLGIGGHDAMWFAVRDLVFDVDAFGDVDPPANIGRPDTATRALPEIAAPTEGLLSFLMNLLIIEFRAEIGFALTQEVLRTPGLFPGRDARAVEASEIIERIRSDELVHVSSLRLYLGELRAVRFRTTEGTTVTGDVLIDRMWDGLVHWATVEQPALAAAQQRSGIEAIISEHPDAGRVRADFDRLADADTV